MRAAMPKEADLAIRDCTSVLAILADRWENAEVYRDCFEVLARAIPGSGELGGEVKEELRGLCRRVEEMGCHRHVVTMLMEMAGDNERGEEMEV